MASYSHYVLDCLGHTFRFPELGRAIVLVRIQQLDLWSLHGVMYSESNRYQQTCEPVLHNHTSTKGADRTVLLLAMYMFFALSDAVGSSRGDLYNIQNLRAP